MNDVVADLLFLKVVDIALANPFMTLTLFGSVLWGLTMTLGKICGATADWLLRAD